LEWENSGFFWLGGIGEFEGIVKWFAGLRSWRFRSTALLTCPKVLFEN